MKIFDYKFLILLGLTLVVYFLYREVESLKKKVKKLNNNLLENKVSNDNYSENDNLKNLKENNDDIIQIELPPNPEKNLEEKPNNDIKLIENIVNNSEQQQTKTLKQSNNTIYKSELKVINVPLKMQNKETEILNVTSTNSENDNINDYSNTSEKLEIYSNDDEDNEDSSIIESLEDLSKKKTNVESFEGTDNRLEESKQLSVDDLLKNKLAELQNMAKDLDIVTTKKEKGKNKKKTKLELAKDIISKSQ